LLHGKCFIDVWIFFFLSGIEKSCSSGLSKS
jgi:hypothetical protein